jgi:hypothetical protein
MTVYITGIVAPPAIRNRDAPTVEGVSAPVRELGTFGPVFTAGGSVPVEVPLKKGGSLTREISGLNRSTMMKALSTPGTRLVKAHLLGAIISPMTGSQ